MSENLFEGISFQRLLGTMLQGFNLARLGQQKQQKQQPTYKPGNEPPAEISQATHDQARASQAQADRELVTNDKGQAIHVEFPAND